MVSSLNQVYEQYGENKNSLVVIGISLMPGDNQEKIEKFRKDNKGQYPEIEGTKYGAEIYSKYRSYVGDGFPSLCLINPGTKEIAWHEVGYKPYNVLETVLTENGVEKQDALSINMLNSKSVQKQFLNMYVHNNNLIFNASGPASYKITLLSLQGITLESLIYDSRLPGLQTVSLNNEKVPNGSYVVHIINDFQKVSKRITVLK